KQLDILKPFGKGNSKPVFVSENLKVLSPRFIGKNKNVVKMVVVDETGYKMDAIYFGDAKEFVNDVTANVPLTLTYSPSINSYMGRENLQIVIIDYK
ncbi:MAG: single-stranded-DNA-specific exonuclease RecJ, partial [Veillonella sp.]|nr:single-stranded-DNA-specific exonuclease RecJ [Veillonella sp.]